MASDGNQHVSLSKDDSEEMLNKRIEQIRLKNEEAMRRHKLKEEDRHQAELIGRSVTLQMASAKKVNQVFNAVAEDGVQFFKEPRVDRSHFMEPVEQSVTRSVATSGLNRANKQKSNMSVNDQRCDNLHSMHRSQQDTNVATHRPANRQQPNKRLADEKGDGNKSTLEVPPPDPSFNFLADRMRDVPNSKQDAVAQTSRRHKRNFGGANFDNVPAQVQLDRERKMNHQMRGSGPRTRLEYTALTTGHERLEYDKWKSEREKIDLERVQRQLNTQGEWKREWDRVKISQNSDNIPLTSFNSDRVLRPGGRIGSGRFASLDVGASPAEEEWKNRPARDEDGWNFSRPPVRSAASKDLMHAGRQVSRCNDGSIRVQVGQRNRTTNDGQDESGIKRKFNKTGQQEKRYALKQSEAGKDFHLHGAYPPHTDHRDSLTERFRKSDQSNVRRRTPSRYSGRGCSQDKQQPHRRQNLSEGSSSSQMQRADVPRSRCGRTGTVPLSVGKRLEMESSAREDVAHFIQSRVDNDQTGEAEEERNDETTASGQNFRRDQLQQQQSWPPDRTSNKQQWSFGKRGDRRRYQQRRNGRPSSAQNKQPRHSRQRAADEDSRKTAASVEDSKDADGEGADGRVVENVNSLPVDLVESGSSSSTVDSDGRVDRGNMATCAADEASEAKSESLQGEDGSELLPRLTAETCETFGTVDEDDEDDDEWEDVDETGDGDDDDDDNDEMISADDDENGESVVGRKIDTNGFVVGSADISEYVSPCDSVENLQGQLDDVPSQHHNRWSDEEEAMSSNSDRAADNVVG